MKILNFFRAMVLAADHFVHAGGEAKDFSLQSRLMKHFRHAHLLIHYLLLWDIFTPFRMVNLVPVCSKKLNNRCLAYKRTGVGTHFSSFTTTLNCLLEYRYRLQYRYQHRYCFKRRSKGNTIF
jgi:hypothetical protein